MGRADSRGRSRDPSRRRRDSRRRSRGRSGSSRGKVYTGRCVTWNLDKGFGFLRPDRVGDDIFVHVSGLRDGDALREGAEVRYEKGWDHKADKHHAVQVTGACRERDLRRARDSRSRSRGSRGRGGDRSRGRSRGGGRSRSRGGKEICRQYQRRGNCDWGERCKFEH